MLHTRTIQDKLNSLENKLDTLAKKEDVESLRKEFEDFRDDYLLSTNQKYLLKKIKSHIFHKYDKIKLKYVKNEDSYVREKWEYKDEDIIITKTIYKVPHLNYCSSLSISFEPSVYFNTSEEYTVEYKGNVLEDRCSTKEIFEKLQEYKKSA